VHYRVNCSRQPDTGLELLTQRVGCCGFGQVRIVGQISDCPFCRVGVNLDANRNTTEAVD
jgi:hypothetical protein